MVLVWRDVAVSHNLGFGIPGMEFLQQLTEGLLLCRCTVIYFGETSEPSHVDAHLIVALHAVAHPVLVEQLRHGAISRDSVMVSGITPSLLYTEEAEQAIDCLALAAASAMHENVLNVSHDFGFYRWDRESGGHSRHENRAGVAVQSVGGYCAARHLAAA